MELNKAFGQLLRSTREEQGVSQEKLAELSGLDRTFISLLERGLRQPSLTSLFLLARALKTSPTEMIAKLEGMPLEVTPH